MKITACKQKILIEIISTSICILLGMVLLVPIIWNVYKLVNSYGIGFGLLLSSAGIVICILWFCLLLILFLSVKLLLKILHLSLNITENDCVVINHNCHEWRIPNEKIKYILGENTGAMLVWDKDGEIKTFFIKKSYFTKISYEDIVTLLSNIGEYHSNKAEIIKIRKQLGLNHVFRKNKLEYELEHY